MPEYKLTYFNMMGRAEPARLIFAYAGVAFVDERIERRDWPNMKPNMPHGQLPVLHVDGKRLAQSRTIERYLAKVFGLDGQDEWETAKMDELVSAVEDLLNHINPWFKEQDNAKKGHFSPYKTFKNCQFEVEIFKALCDSEILPFIARFEALLLENKTGYFVGDTLSYADLAIFHIFWFLNTKILPGSLRKYPKLHEFVERTAAIPRIKQWMAKRPRTEA